jgi:predicted nucleic acid-binding protein
VIHLDTSVLVDALTGQKRSAGAFRAAIAGGERVLLTTIVLYEWLRGPRLEPELAMQAALFPPASVIAFGPEEARCAADLYRGVSRARDRDLDLAVAACALTHDARLWTLNVADFTDLPNLKLYAPDEVQ